LRARLEEQKKALGHGKWLPWIRETFGQDDAAIQKIQRFLRKPNTSLLTYLPETTVQNNTETTERIPNRVTVVESATEVGQPIVQADDDPPPNPPTNRKVSAGSKKVREEDKPQTQSVTPVVVCEPELVEPNKAEFEEKRSQISPSRKFWNLCRLVGGDEKTVAKATAQARRQTGSTICWSSIN
jgi:hypothetical protein